MGPTAGCRMHTTGAGSRREEAKEARVGQWAHEMRPRLPRKGHRSPIKGMTGPNLFGTMMGHNRSRSDRQPVDGC
jgi:hypothetical protein